jgi:hypothetical protein
LENKNIFLLFKDDSIVLNYLLTSFLGLFIKLPYRSYEKINNFGDFQWGNAEELKLWHIMNVVPLIWRVPDFWINVFSSVSLKINKIIKFYGV